MSNQTMSNETRDELLPRLIQDYALKFSSDRQFLRYGRCPSCGKKELYTGADAPWTIQCGRANKCSYQASTRDIYPDIFANWTERNPPHLPIPMPQLMLTCSLGAALMSSSGKAVTAKKSIKTISQASPAPPCALTLPAMVKRSAIGNA